MALLRSPQQTLPMKLVHHLELGQDYRQDAIDSARKPPSNGGAWGAGGSKKERGKDGIHGS